ncbi:MAG TPA: hypothetical protein V6D30_09560 [Leptolyngbyaceae cyanobacterium]
MSVLAKQNAFSLLNLNSIDELNSGLSQLADSLLRQGKEVPEEIANPEAHENISKEHLTLLRDYKRGTLEELKQLPQVQNGNSNEQGSRQIDNSSLAVTDDEILDVAESTGVDLDIVMSAAMHVENLEALVQWVEEYKRLESEQEIKDSARQQFELDQLRKKEQELGERLNAAINKPTVNVAAIRQRLGVKTPQSVTNLGKWDGKPGAANEPDFLKNARAAFAKKK